MEARERDVDFLRRSGLGLGKEEGEVELRRPLLRPLPRLEWSGWNAIQVWSHAGADALESTAVALPSLKRLDIAHSSLCMVDLSFVEAVATVLNSYPVEQLRVAWTGAQEVVDVVAEATVAWLARSCATALQLFANAPQWELKLCMGLVASPSLQTLGVISSEKMRMAPILAALEGHSRLKELSLIPFGGAVEEQLCMRLAGMPALRSCKILHLGNDGGGVRLEVESMPALEFLCVEECGLVEAALSVALPP